MPSLTARTPAVAGTFYPAEPKALATLVRALLDRAAPTLGAPLAVVSPHAGYRYSGLLTAQAIAATANTRPDSIVVLSPSHRHGFRGIAAPSQDAYSLPTGPVRIDVPARQAMIARNLLHIEDEAHDQEHGVEVQLPFLHRVHNGVPVLPLVLGEVARDVVGELVDALVQRAPQTLFVLSSDLSHFLTLKAAGQRDAATAARIELGEAIELTGQDACGAQAVAGFFASRHGRGRRVTRLAMANSAQTSGDENRTVGYGAWMITPGQGEAVPPVLRRQLLDAARQVLASRFARGRPPHIDTATFPAPLQTYAASFVTLEQRGQLRGCIGSLRAHRPLIEDVASNVQKAAFEDGRFAPLGQGDLERTRLKIAVLSPPAQMQFQDPADLESQLLPGRDGLILRDQGRTATFLPMVWDKLPERGAFLRALKQKAGLREDHWSPTLTVERFFAESFAEDRD